MATTGSVGHAAAATPALERSGASEELSFDQLLRDFPLDGARAGSAPARWRRLLSRPNRGTTAAERYLQVVLARQGRDLRRVSVAAAVAYSLLALLAFSPVNPVSTTDILLGGYFDPSQLTWSLGWLPFAVLHHLNPFFSNYVDYPEGANMATNPLMPLLGVTGAPVTLLLGPVATFNLMFRLAFASSAMAMFVTLRRFVASQPAAFAGGLMYGFSPYMVAQGAFHLSLVVVPFPPLILGALHDLLVAPRRGPLRAGVKLGLLCAAQYFVAQEVLADTALLGAVGVLVLVLARPVETFRTAGFKLRGLGAALGVFVPICAYPVWFEIDGPGHLARVDPFGALLSRSADLLSPIVPTVNELLAPAGLAARGTSFFGGNLVENGGYLGLPLLAVLLVTVVVLFKDPLVRFCGLMILVAFTCALGTQLVVDNRLTSVFLPMNLLGTLPVLSSELAIRYALYVDLFAAILLAVALDRTSRIGSPRRRISMPLWWCWRLLAAAGHGLSHLGGGVAAMARGARLRAAARPSRPDRQPPAVRPGAVAAPLGRLGAPARAARLGRLWTPRAAAFAACALFALLPLVPRLPYHEVPTGVPAAFLDSRLAGAIPPGAVVLTYPYNEPPGTMALMWAATDHYRFRLIGGYFAVPTPNDGGDPFPPPALQPETMRQLLDAAVTNTPAEAPPFDRATIASLRLYVRRWRVDAILFEIGGGDPQLAIRYLEAAFGRPRSTDGFDVWLGLQPRRVSPPGAGRRSPGSPRPSRRGAPRRCG